MERFNQVKNYVAEGKNDDWEQYHGSSATAVTTSFLALRTREAGSFHIMYHTRPSRVLSEKGIILLDSKVTSCACCVSQLQSYLHPGHK